MGAMSSLQALLHYNYYLGGISMKLGAFSVSLTVKDIHKSKAFYENLGFQRPRWGHYSGVANFEK